jgi:hypothetical protein
MPDKAPRTGAAEQPEQQRLRLIPPGMGRRDRRRGRLYGQLPERRIPGLAGRSLQPELSDVQKLDSEGQKWNAQAPRQFANAVGIRGGIWPQAVIDVPDGAAQAHAHRSRRQRGRIGPP